MKKISFFTVQRPINYRILLFVIIIGLGLTFRFVNIDQKSYWDDEAFTALRISGYTEYEVVKKVSQVEMLKAGDLFQYQTINHQKSLIDTINSLVIEEAQHPPLYYVMARLFMQWFDNSIVSIRTLAALISLLVLPCVYWLSMELFGRADIAWIAVVFLSTSPFQLLYAQEGREYSLWIVTILLSTAALLSAFRNHQKVNWVIYTATLAVSFYSFPTSVSVAIAHGVYVFAIEGFKVTQKLISYLLASFAAILTFLPWLLVIIANLGHLKSIVGGQGNMPTLSIIKTWAFNLSRIFIDTNHERAVINLGWENNWNYFIQVTLVSWIFLLSAYSIYYLCRHTSHTVWLLVVSLILVTSLPIMLKDIIYGGTKSIIPRYLTPGYLFIQVSIAYLIGNKIISVGYQQKFWKIVFSTMLSGAIFSGVMISQAHHWWNKSHSDMNFQDARLINQFEQPLLISDGSMGRILSLSHLLDSDVKLQLKPYCHTCRDLPEALLNKDIVKVPNGFNVFLFVPSIELKQAIEGNQNYELQPLTTDLWLINKAR